MVVISLFVFYILGLVAIAGGYPWFTPIAIVAAAATLGFFINQYR
jgi:hypothetical protein